MDYRSSVRRIALLAVATAVVTANFMAWIAPALARARVPIVLIVMENKTYQTIRGTKSAPYLNGTFIPKGTLYTNYWSISHPSLPNYLALTAGSTLDCKSDACALTFTQNNLFHQLDAKSVGWRGYAESMPSACDGSNAGDYVIRHNPAPYYTDLRAGSCNHRDIAYPTTLPRQLRPFTFVTPNVCNDMHSCSISTGDAWLATHVPALLSKGAVVIITFDEGSDANPQVLTAVVGPHIRAGLKDGTRYDHYGLLAGLERYFGVPQLKNAATATPLPIRVARSTPGLSRRI